MILSIETTENIKVQIIDNKKIIAEIISDDRTDQLLKKIDELGFKKYQKQIKQIKVNLGPGGYTSTRLGVTVANIINIFFLNKKQIFRPKYKEKDGSLPFDFRP